MRALRHCEPQFIGERFHLALDLGELPPRYNAAPTQSLPVVLEADGRRGEGMRWGLVPPWARAGAKPVINARVETVADQPLFRLPFRRRRCLVPATHCFEWQTTVAGKVPQLIRPTDQRLFAFAGLYDTCRGANGEERRGFAILTTTPNGLVAALHDRMPVILRPADEAAWLDAELTDAAALRSLCRPYPAAAMEAYPVGRLVNAMANDTADVLLPLAS